MVELSVERGDLVLEIRGWSKLWALKKQLRVPLAEIRAVRRDPQAAKGSWKGWRMPGTHIPGVITAGTFYRRTGREFWDVRSGSKAVTIELDRGTYRGESSWTSRTRRARSGGSKRRAPVPPR
jgi:hypothetical protein